MDSSLPLQICNTNVFKHFIIINRFHALIHCIAIAFLIYYRASFLFQDPKNRETPILPWFLLFASELILSFRWVLCQSNKWRPISRTVFPKRLCEDNKLPGIDVFICTTDPNKEPTLGVMNTVISALALDYPAEKLHVYLSDDGGSAITLHGIREAWRFARSWVPFCRKYEIKTRAPLAYFSCVDDEDEDNYLCKSNEFMAERDKIKEKFEKLKECIMKAREKGWLGENSRNHSPIIEVLNEATQEDDVRMAMLVYVSREKRPSYPHHFKAGALNVLLRVSGVISNCPYILFLDCDMYCNDPSSARQAMCFHLDPNISSSLAFVQFPQKFHNLSANDIYDGEIRNVFRLSWYAMDGQMGPIVSGTNFYMKRESLYGRNIHEVGNIEELKNSFGLSNEFIRSLQLDYKPSSNIRSGQDYSSLLQETKILASCAYENDTKWGNKVGFMYDTVLEDYMTGYRLHCNGWKSVYLNPSRPQFLGTSPTNLNDYLIQNTRWSSGLIGAAISKFCPLIHGPSRMSFLQCMCYAEIAFTPLYCFPLCCFATIPQLGLLSGIPLYPQVSNPFFFTFSFIFISAIVKHLFDVLYTGGSIQIMRNEQRIWMIKSVTCHAYGSLDAIMKVLGIREANFLPTNKVEDYDQIKLYQRGIFDFQASPRLLAPLVTIAILNMASFFVGIIRMVITGDFDKYFVQVFLSFYILAMNYAIIEGMMIRKDKGRIPPSVTLKFAVFLMILLALGFMVLIMY